MSTSPLQSGPGFEKAYATRGSAQGAAPTSSGNGFVKVILLVAAALVFFVVVGAGVLGYVGYKASKIIHQGAVANGELNPAELGVVEYPHSVRSMRNGATIKMNIPGGTSVVAAQYTTPDSPAQVTDFYKGALGRAADVTNIGDRTAFTLARDNDQRTVLIRPADNGGSHITITRRYSTP